MEQMSEESLLPVIIEWIQTNKRTSENFAIAPDTEILASGLLDSFSLLDLILHIESLTGHAIDLADADPSDFSVVRGLCRLALRNGSRKEEPCAS